MSWTASGKCIQYGSAVIDITLLDIDEETEITALSVTTATFSLRDPDGEIINSRDAVDVSNNITDGLFRLVLDPADNVMVTTDENEVHTATLVITYTSSVLNTAVTAHGTYELTVEKSPYET